jgi:YVTN family beta-propeller protein
MNAYLSLIVAIVVCGGAAVVDVPESPKVIQRIPGPDGGWDYASFDADRHRVLISRSYGVMTLDIDNGEVAQLAEGNGVHASFILPDGRVLITNGRTGTTTLANSSTGAIEATIPVGKSPDAAVYDPVSDRVFVMNANSGDISVIDTRLGKEDARIAVGGKLEAAAVDAEGRLFVNIEDKAKVAVIDTRTRAVERRFDLSGCKEPNAIAYIASEQLLVSTCANEVAKVIGARDGHEVMDIPIGPHPDDALVDPHRGRVFIATAGSREKNGEITVLGIGGSPAVTVLERIPTQRGARTLAEDPKTGRLYLPTATYVVGAADGKPHLVDGTFRVLVVEPQLESH